MTRKKTAAFALHHREALFFFGLIAVLAALHFHNPGEIFTRLPNLIDDDSFVQPVSKVDFMTYFKELLPDRTTSVYPLKDLFYALDFKLSDWLGIQTFWLTNFIFFSAVLFFISKVFELFFPGQFYLRAFLLAITALHPINVEIVQWAAMRKHVIAVLFMALGSIHVFRKYLDDNARLTTRDIKIVGGLTFLSFLSWPTTIFWPLAVIWVWRRKLIAQQAPIFALVVGTLLSIGFLFRIGSSGNTEYEGYRNVLMTGDGAMRALGWIWRGAGRGVFNILIPIRLSTFFDMYSVVSKIGLVILIGLLAYFAWFTLKMPRTTPALIKDRRYIRLGWDLLAYSAILIAPQTYPVVGNESFLWMDHYLYAEIPFIFAALACFGKVAAHSLLSKIHRASLATVCFLILGTSIALSARQIPRWHDSVTLLSACAAEEECPLCTIIALEKGYDAKGCSFAFPMLDKAKALYSKRRKQDDLKYDPLFSLELPLIDSLCTATAVNLDFNKKMLAIEEQESFYRRPTALLLARTLSFLSAHDLKGAWQLASSTYLNPQYLIDAPTEKILTLLDGQAQALCQLSDALKTNPECGALLETYRKRIRPFLHDLEKKAPVQREWSKNLALTLYSDSR